MAITQYIFRTENKRLTLVL